MEFRTNSYQQLSFTDSFGGDESREQKKIGTFMGKGFCRRYISCNQRRTIPRSVFIQRFKTKYTRKCVNWRPDDQRNLGISDDEVVENLMLDPRYQYALHTTSFDEQPMSDKTLSRFRKRCYDYESIYGVDLLHGCMTGLGTNIAKLTGYQSKNQKNGFYDDSGKYPKTQPHRTAAYLCSKTGYLSSQKPLRQSD